jgi:CubicO group peptidase (beta-lactamase class C family)
LDRPVDGYLSGWHVPKSRFDAEGVTLRRILRHTAGLSVHGFPGFAPDDRMPSLIELLKGKGTGDGAVRLLQAPGQEWRYSGGGYAVAQLLLEEQTGEAFEAFMLENVLVPLGMTSSDYRWTPELEARSATPYDRRGRPMYRNQFRAVAAAGLQTTPRDLARFGIACMPSFRSDEAKEVLSDALLRTSLGRAPTIPEIRAMRSVPNAGTTTASSCSGTPAAPSVGSQR